MTEDEKKARFWQHSGDKGVLNLFKFPLDKIRVADPYFPGQD